MQLVGHIPAACYTQEDEADQGDQKETREIIVWMTDEEVDQHIQSVMSSSTDQEVQQ